MEQFSRGLSMDVELTGIVGTDEMGLGRLGKHSLPHFRTSSPVDHEMEGLWETSQGRPRTIPAVDSSRTNRQMLSMCNWPTRNWMGPTQCRTCPRPRGLPVIDWILYGMSLSLFLSWSWWHKSAEMKLPADPESRMAWTEIQWRGVVSCTIVVSGCTLTEEEETTLTTGRWGRTGHVRITCPFWPQYRHNPWVSRHRRSARGQPGVVDLHGFVLWFWRAGKLWLVERKGWILASIYLHTAVNPICHPDGELDKALEPHGVIISGEMLPQRGL